VATEELRERVNHNAGAMLQRLAQVRRCHGVVDDKRNAGFAGNCGNRGDIGDASAGICEAFDEDRLGLGADGLFERGDIIAVRPVHMPVKLLEGVVELVD
jgi:hypothetical protein